MRQSTFAVLAVIAVTGTVSLPAAAQGTPQTRQSATDVVLRVENHNWLDMHIYVVASGSPLRSLGTVTALSTEELKLPPDVVHAGSDLRLVADPIGMTGVYVSPTLIPNPRSVVVLSIENNLDLTSTSLRPRTNAG